MSKRYAAMDIGTVTCRLLVADVDGGKIEVVDREYGITNLGEGVDASGMLKPEAIDRVVAQVRSYLQVIERLRVPGEPPIPLTAMATSASRDARNSADFVGRLDELGVKLSVIPGEREAGLTFAGAASAFPGETLLVVDVGGGSTELIVGRAGQDPQMVHSFNIGCRRVTERFFQSDPPSCDEMDAANKWMRGEFAPYFDKMRAKGLAIDRIVAVAGTATSIVAVDKALVPYDSSQVHGAPVSTATLAAVHERLASIPEDERRRVPGLDPDRAPVIVAGTLILQAVVDLAHTDGFTASEADILEGILLDRAGY